jgi:cell division protein FtsL
MRKSTFLWLALAAFCGTTLFHTSQKIHDAQEKLGTLARAIAKEDKARRVLAAEWGYLNQPDRLEKLAGEYLNMAPLKGTQLASWADLPARGIPVLETPAALQKPVIAVPAPPVKKKPSSKSITRNFSDVMKSLRFN